MLIMNIFSFSHNGSIFTIDIFITQLHLTLYYTIQTFNDPKDVGFGKHCSKRRKCWLPTVFSALTKRKTFILSMFNPFSNKPWFLHICSTSLLKTLWEKEKLLITSNFSFSHRVFYLFGELFAIFIKFDIVVRKLFLFGRVENLSVWKGLICSQQMLSIWSRQID